MSVNFYFQGENIMFPENNHFYAKFLNLPSICPIFRIMHFLFIYLFIFIVITCRYEFMTSKMLSLQKKKKIMGKKKRKKHIQKSSQC